MNRHPEYRYTIGNTENLWIYVEDMGDSGWGSDVFDWSSENSNTGPLELLLRIRDKTGWTIEEVGPTQYKFMEDSLGLIYQWDDLFGFVIIAQSLNHLYPAKRFLGDYFN